MADPFPPIAGTAASLRLLPPRTRLALRFDPALLPAVGAGAPASLVDVSHRHRAFEVSGPAAAALLNEGCPLDLDDAAFPAGACTRTLFGKIEILLWRPAAASTFQVEVARSFAAPLRALLAEALADLDGEA